MRTRVLRVGVDDLPLPGMVDGRGEVRAVVRPGVQARYRSLHYLVLRPKARTVPHQHNDAEAVYYVVQGTGCIEDLSDRYVHSVSAGSFVLIAASTRYSIVAGELRTMICVGGPCPPDPLLYQTIYSKTPEVPS